MRAWRWMITLVGVAMGLAGCREKPVTEADLQQAIAEHQQRTTEEIKRTVETAPPPYAVPNQQKPGGAPAPSSGTPQTPQPTPGLEIPPPNTYSSPPPTQTETPVAPTTGTGDIKLDPQTGQYGIHPPGAPETYTIPLNNPQTQGQ
ncbi:MAG: hypothetical protein N2045_07405 [Fimbriimonadales bacterium]|jgi:hypothetical protein|nr:hypothetical protein [Fimbriimonadales bacterium]GIV12875.1 MAG: hypothetical protein KatS3mg021_1157 [Fimbriimonadales bacterium]CUU11084.1 hypothetical protein GBSOP10_109632 [Armatimonadetes bacterium GBS]CUU37722.1 hypothetical protein GXSOP10_13426 [Armatimonadetes bacterium GXS]